MVESEKTVRSSFMSGVLWLSLSTLLVKLIGLLYKIPMLSCLGAVGMGYFHFPMGSRHCGHCLDRH